MAKLPKAKVNKFGFPIPVPERKARVKPNTPQVEVAKELMADNKMLAERVAKAEGQIQRNAHAAQQKFQKINEAHNVTNTELAKTKSQLKDADKALGAANAKIQKLEAKIADAKAKKAAKAEKAAEKAKDK